MKTRLLLATALLAALAAAPPAAAQTPAESDTSLGGFLGQFSDSTDRFFGVSAAPVDTAGLDTVLSDSGLRPRRRLELGFAPTFDFSRVDGSTPGLSASLGAPAPEPGRTGWGKLRGNVARALGPDVTLGGGRYQDRLVLARQPFDLDLWIGRKTGHLDRDDDDPLAMVGAFLTGSDWTQYCRNDGFEGSLTHPHGWWRASAGFRDLLQSPLRTTATWNLFNQALERPGNLAAAYGRTHELGYEASAHWPGLPLLTEIAYQTSSRRLGSDFEYRRVRVAAGLDLTLGRFASLVPQFAWGRLTGDEVPQAAFYLGGNSMLRSLPRDQLGGTGMAIAKLDLIGAQDLLALLHVPHPAALPLQGAVFAASGTMWGRDPYSGAVTPGGNWPDGRDWRSEVGVSLLYNTAIFPTLHISHAWPVGPHAGGGRWCVSLSRPLDLLHAEPEEQTQ
jgi:hypothetical protein